MDRLSRDLIIQHHKLIPKSISRKVLWAISHNLPINDPTIFSYISAEKFEELRKAYKLQQAKSNGTILSSFPRNLFFYEIIQNHLSNFSWTIREKQVTLKIPKIDGIMEPSLLSMLLGLGNTETQYSRFYYQFKKILNEDILNSFYSLLQQVFALIPERNEMALIIEWLKKGINGEPLTIFSMACPDYSVEPTKNPSCPYRHTFKEVGDGIGLVAQRILDATPLFLQFLKQNQIVSHHKLAMADYEVLSESTLQKLNISKNVFLQKIKSSINACKDNQPLIDSFMFSDLCCDLSEWKNLYLHYRSRFSQGDFGESKLTHKKLIEIAKSRKDFYDRWFGPQVCFDNYISILLDQGAEYAVIGKMIAKHFPNCLILGADSSLLADFYCIDQKIPTLYLKRFYC